MISFLCTSNGINFHYFLRRYALPRATRNSRTRYFLKLARKRQATTLRPLDVLSSPWLPPHVPRLRRTTGRSMPLLLEENRDRIRLVIAPLNELEADHVRTTMARVRNETNLTVVLLFSGSFFLPRGLGYPPWP